MFKFKEFTIHQELCAMKVGTDGVLLGAWAQIPHPESKPSMGLYKVLDVGTGTGIIALMMAQRYTDAYITAIDIDEGSVMQALQNVQATKFAQRVEILKTPVQALGTEHEGKYDAVVCNPPYFIDGLKTTDMSRNRARHSDTLTYGELMSSAWKLLCDEGELSVIVPFDYRKRMEDEAVFVGFFPHRICAVRTVARKPARRYLLSFRKHPCERIFKTMTIGDEDYQRLTRDFYLRLSTNTHP